MKGRPLGFDHHFSRYVASSPIRSYYYSVLATGDRRAEVVIIDEFEFETKGIK